MTAEAYVILTDIGTSGIGYDLSARYVLITDESNTAFGPGLITVGPFLRGTGTDEVNYALAQEVRTAENDQEISVIFLYPFATGGGEVHDEAPSGDYVATPIPAPRP